MAKVNPGVRKGSRTVVVSYTNDFGGGSYTGNIVGEHSSFGMGGLRVAGWRKTTHYQVFAAEIKLDKYDFYDNINVNYVGTTDHVNGVSFIAAGLQNHGIYRHYQHGIIPEVSSSLIDQVKIRAMQQLGGQKVNLSASTAELGQTIELLVSLALRLIRLLKAIKKLDVKGALSAISGGEVKLTKTGYRYKGYKTVTSAGKTAAQRLNRTRSGKLTHIGGWTEYRRSSINTIGSPSNLWLELQYGILPLLGDIQGILTLMATQPKKPRLISGFSRTSVSMGTPIGNTFATEGTSIAGAECKVWATIKDAEVRSAAQRGLSLPGLIGGIWEAVPYSFVIDWVLPIGSILEACAAMSGLAFHDAYIGLKRENEFKAYRNTYLSATKPSRRVPTLWISSIAYRRDVLYGFPVPGFYFKNPFSTPHLLNAIALITSSGSTIR